MKNKRIVPADVGLQPYDRYEDEDQIGFTTPILDAFDHLQSIAEAMGNICDEESENLNSGKEFNSLRWLEAFEACVLIDHIKASLSQPIDLNKLLYLSVRIGTLSAQAKVRPAEKQYSIGVNRQEWADYARSRRPPKFVLERGVLLDEIKQIKRRFPNAKVKAIQEKIATNHKCSQATIANLCRAHRITAKDYSV